MGLFAKVFRNNSDEKLIEAVNNGLDVNLYENSSRYYNFYSAAISFGSPKLVRTCLLHGANPICFDGTLLYRPFPAVSALVLAMQSRRSDNVEILMTAGAKHKKLFKKGIAWNMRNNLCPETPEELDPADRKRFLEFKHSIKEGTKILQVFKKRQVKIPGIDPDYSSASFFSIDYNADILQDNHHIPEKELEAFFEISIDSDFMLYPMPCQGTRKNALWHYATPKAMKEALRFLDPNTRDKAGWTTLHHIAMYGDVDYYFMPEKVVKLLIKAGADVNATNKYGVNPLMIASAKAYSTVKMFEVVKALIRNGADYMSKDKDRHNRRNAMEWLIGDHVSSTRHKMILEIFHEILNSVYGYGLSDIDLDLLVKVLWGTPEDIELALFKGANINLYTKLGYTPLMMAAVFNDLKAVDFLLRHGSDIFAHTNEGETALSLAANVSDIEAMTFIIGYGGDFDSLRWIDRNYYAKRINRSDLYQDYIQEETAKTLKKFGLNL